VAAGLLWGTGGLTGRLLERSSGLPAPSVAAYRLATGGALIIIVLVLTGRRWPAGRAAWARIAAIAGLAAVFQGCYFTAVSLTSVSVATLVTIGSAPVLVLAGERARGQRRSRRLAGGATGLALTGLGLLAGLPSGGFPETAVLASAGLAVLAAAGFATLTLISARPVAGLDDLTATGFGFTLGGLALLPVAAAAGGAGFTPTPVTFGLLAVLGTGPTAVAYTLYFRGLRTAPAGIAALLSLLEPLTGTILAAQRGGEHRGDDRHGAGAPAERAMQPAGHQHLVGDVEGHVGKQHGEQRDHHAAVAELGPGLDHLRQPEYRALGGVEGHEQRAEPDAEYAGQNRPAQRQAERRADEADRDGEVLEVPEKPQHGLLPGLAVPLRVRDPVDRVHLDLAAQATLKFMDCGSECKPS